MSSHYDARGRTVLVTGGTSGVGLETAKILVAAGAEVMIVGSDSAKGADAQRAVNRQGGGEATFVAADLSSMREAHRLASTVGDRWQRLDVLINNAGIVTTSRQVTVDGYERTFAVNYLAALALTGDLLPLLKRAPHARIVSLTAAVEPIGRLDFDDLEAERHFGGLRAYAQSKRALSMYTIELSRRLGAEGGGITANVVNPFLVRTGLTSADDVPLLFKLARPLMIDPARAARWVAAAAIDQRFADTTGRHLMFGRRAPTPPGSANRRAATALWEVSGELARAAQGSAVPAP